MIHYRVTTAVLLRSVDIRGSKYFTAEAGSTMLRRKLHYILVVQWSIPQGIKYRYRTGIYLPGRGQTRSDIFNELFATAIQDISVPEECAPIPTFFTLERNRV